jgi:transcriptional regulator with XRE-family HTH domain
MYWQNAADKRCKVAYSLRDLRVAKGLTIRSMAEVLEISKTQYCTIESGHRKPTMDVLFKLAAVYQTSMDFVYHAFYRQHFIWNFPDHDLKYAMKEAAQLDILYLRDREPPLAPPKLQEAYIFEVTEDGAEVGTNVYGNYG